MSTRDESTLLDIVRAAERAVAFAGTDEADFAGDEKTQAAVVYQLLIVGEAVKRLSTEFRDSNPDVPWREIAGMRDQLIHRYDQVDLHEVWRAVTRDIPDLLAQLRPLLPEEP
jgi:uncharacterized protein with HEPN domain